MGCKIYVSKKGFLVYRLQWNNQRSWEGTTLRDTPANWKRVEADADLISREIRAGRFDYARWFPAGNKGRGAAAGLDGSTVLRQVDPAAAAASGTKEQRARYKQHFNRYVLPQLGEVLLAALTTRQLIDFQNYLLHDVPRLKRAPNLDSQPRQFGT